jgi:glutathione S-transferase
MGAVCRDRFPSRALEAIQPEPSLFSLEAERRRAVEEAEAWGERELQPVPRRIFRWAVVHRMELRRWLARAAGMPAPSLTARVMGPVVRYMARKVGANDAGVRADVAALPLLLDRVDSLIAAGTIGGEAPNAADYQIGTTVRVLIAFDDLRPLVGSRPAGELALRLLPEYPGPIPPVLPPAWLGAAGR